MAHAILTTPWLFIFPGQRQAQAAEQNVAGPFVRRGTHGLVDAEEQVRQVVVPIQPRDLFRCQPGRCGMDNRRNPCAVNAKLSSRTGRWTWDGSTIPASRAAKASIAAASP